MASKRQVSEAMGLWMINKVIGGKQSEKINTDIFSRHSRAALWLKKQQKTWATDVSQQEDTIAELKYTQAGIIHGQLQIHERVFIAFGIL